MRQFTMTLTLMAGLMSGCTSGGDVTSDGLPRLGVPVVRAMRTSHAGRNHAWSNVGLPTFQGSFTTDGVVYPYTMVGGDPRRGGRHRSAPSSFR